MQSPFSALRLEPPRLESNDPNALSQELPSSEQDKPFSLSAELDILREVPALHSGGLDFGVRGWSLLTITAIYQLYGVAGYV